MIGKYIWIPEVFEVWIWNRGSSLSLFQNQQQSERHLHSESKFSRMAFNRFLFNI